VRCRGTLISISSLLCVGQFFVLKSIALVKWRRLILTLAFLPVNSVLAQPDAWLPELVTIPAGAYISGSQRQERDEAYTLDEVAYGHSITRTQRWYESEHAQQERVLPEYSIMKTPVTHCDYARFVRDRDYPAPSIDRVTWDSQGLKHGYQSTLKFQWLNDGQSDHDRCDHPVVLVSHVDAMAYAAWLSAETGRAWRLPDEFEWEKAARGINGNLFPWGNRYDPAKLNSHDSGPFDTLPVGTFPEGASPFGMLDAAGQIFEWTATDHPNGKRFVVKGGSWDDKGCGVCRPAARHYRPTNLKHILVGFRLVTD